MFHKYAIVCTPADTVINALRMKDLGKVNFVRLKEQHQHYCVALQNFGYTLIVLPPDHNYPDSVFVEDPAIAIGSVQIVAARLAKKEREGEVTNWFNSLSKLFPFSRLHSIMHPGTIEGGDVVTVDGMLFIGLSERTNEAGAEQLARIAHDFCGWKSNIFRIPKSYLHLKGQATFHAGLLGKRTITASEEIAAHFKDSRCRIIETPASERFGANCISDQDKILVHSGCPKTKRILRELGCRVTEIPLGEFAKIDGAMTCLSKLFVV